MVRTYYRLRMRFDGAEWWALWYSDERGPDGVQVDESGRLLVYPTAHALERAAAHLGAEVASDPAALHDLDKIGRWLTKPRPAAIDCREFLAAWNLLSDVAQSIGAHLPERGEPADTVYEKLFWGGNYPSVTPPGSAYAPEWTPSETAALQAILTDGLALLRSRLAPIA